MRRVVGGVGLLVLMGATTACGGEPAAPSPPTPTAAPTVAAEPSPTPTPTPAPTDPPDEIGVVMDLSEPEIGFELVDVPTDLEGDAADVYNTIALFEREYWRGMTLNEVSPIIYLVAGPDVTAIFEQFTATNVENGKEFSGTFRATVTDVAVTGDAASAMVCDDYEDVEFRDADGTYTADDVGFSPPDRSELTLTRGVDPGQWSITVTEKVGSC